LLRPTSAEIPLNFGESARRKKTAENKTICKKKGAETSLAEKTINVFARKKKSNTFCSFCVKMISYPQPLKSHSQGIQLRGLIDFYLSILPRLGFGIEISRDREKIPNE